MHYKAPFLVSTYEADFKGRLRLSAILNYMQEVAARNAEQLGFGYQDFLQKGLFWVLSRTKIVIEQYPKIGEEFVIETWPKKIHSLFALRDFLLFSAQGKCFGKATTAWIIMNKQSRKPVRPESVMSSWSGNDPEHAIQQVPGKIKEPLRLHQEKEISVAYSAIDINQHVNNVKYLEYVLDCFSDSEHSSMNICELQMNFLQECKFGDKIIICKGVADSEYFEGVSENANKIFQVRFLYNNNA